MDCREKVEPSEPVRLTWSSAALTRLAYSAACQDLSDGARAEVVTSSDGYLRAGNLVEQALRLSARADDALRLAVAAERTRGTSWQDIGDALGTTKQSAHERYAEAVEDIAERILFPYREGAPGSPGWMACPDGLENPERTARTLDGWASRDRRPTDPPLAVAPVSGELERQAVERELLDAIAVTTELASRLINHRLPAGVSERAATRTLLEAKVRANDLIAAGARGARKHEAAVLSAQAFGQLVEWHLVDVRESLGHVVLPAAFPGDLSSEAHITCDGKIVRLLRRIEASVDGTVIAEGAWLLWPLDDSHSAVDGAEEFVGDYAATLADVLDHALGVVARDIAGERAKALLVPGGISRSRTRPRQRP